MIQSFENIHDVCVIVAHPDDPEFFCGGTIALLRIRIVRQSFTEPY